MRERAAWQFWLALALPPLAWFGYQQGLGATVRTACAAAGPPWGLAAGFAALAVCALAAWMARPPRGFLDWLALGFAGLFGLAIAYHMLAAGIVPPCAR
jgi:hypothetical protein